MRMATSWPTPTFNPEAVADIHSPMGTKLKNMARNTIIRISIKMGAMNSIGFLLYSVVYFVAMILYRKNMT